MKIGEIANSIGSLSTNNLINKSLSQTQDSGESFSDMLKESLNDVNKSQLEGYKAMEEIATGKVQNLQEAVQKIQEAEITLKFALEVKNKALNAYKQISQMQI